MNLIILCVPLTIPSTVISSLYARLGGAMDDLGMWEGAVLFGGCSPTAPPSDTGGHTMVGAKRGGEGQLPCSMNIHPSLSHCLLYLCWASASGVVSSQNPDWSLSEPKDAASQSREKASLWLRAGGKQWAVLKMCQGRGVFGELFALLTGINTVPRRIKHCFKWSTGTKGQFVWTWAISITSALTSAPKHRKKDKFR